jgi:hypothetical protein
MSQDTVEYRIKFHLFIASPGDVAPERKAIDKVLADYNSGEGKLKRITLEAFKWERDAFASLHVDGAQGAIDEQARIEDRDLLIGIFWTRFGTETASGETGTEHELRKAFESWKQFETPQIMLFFKEAAYHCKSKSDTDQWGRVLEFARQLPREFLTTPFTSAPDFTRKLKEQLPKMVGYLSDPDITKAILKRAGMPGFRIASPPSQNWARIKFLNRSAENITLSWVNSEGKPADTQILAPGASGAHNSWLGHVFLAEAADGRCQMFKARLPDNEVEIISSRLMDISRVWPKGA